jgi:glycerate dehydrogenase
MKIVVLDSFTLSPDASVWAWLGDFGAYEVFERTSPAKVVARCKGAQAVFTNKVVLGAAELALLPDLRYIGVLATGYNVVDIPAATKQGITVTNIPAYSTASVAQNVFAHLLNVTNAVAHYAADPRRWAASPDFCYRDTRLTELAGKVMGIVGFGRTGRATAMLAQAFGMQVQVFTSQPREALPEGMAKVSMDALFATSDVVSLHCPLTPDTHHLVGASRLAVMRRDAILINTSRGPIVDEQALADALLAGHLRAACLDVLSTEPPLPDNPLLTAPRCYITPHISWATEEACVRLMEICRKNFASFIAGAPVNVIR